jgi:hypothetical protein
MRWGVSLGIVLAVCLWALLGCGPSKEPARTAPERTDRLPPQPKEEG